MSLEWTLDSGGSMILTFLARAIQLGVRLTQPPLRSRHGKRLRPPCAFGLRQRLRLALSEPSELLRGAVHIGLLTAQSFAASMLSKSFRSCVSFAVTSIVVVIVLPSLSNYTISAKRFPVNSPFASFFLAQKPNKNAQNGATCWASVSAIAERCAHCLANT